MINSPLPRRPSDDPLELRDQLLGELERLENEGQEADEPWLFRAYLQHAQTLAWQGVAEGKLGIPRQVLDSLSEVQPVVDANSPETLAPAARAALEVDAVIRSLYAAAETMEEILASLRLAEDHSETARAVLQVLLNNRSTYLRRGDIYEQLAPEQRPTAPRIGQILAELYHQGLLLRIHGRAQGSPNASFYALSPKGFEVCRGAGLVEKKPPMALPIESEIKIAAEVSEPDEPSEATQRIIEQAVITMLDPSVPWESRSIVAGLLANDLKASSVPYARAQLVKWWQRFEKDPKTELLLRTMKGTLSYHLGSLVAAALIANDEIRLGEELIGAIRQVSKPSKMAAFRVRNQAIAEPLLPSSSWDPYGTLTELVSTAEAKRRSLFNETSRDYFEWVLFNGASVDLALRFQGALRPGNDLIEAINSMYLLGHSSSRG